MKLKFPYGISHFAKLIQENYVYVDRSDRISLLEQAGEQLLFLRPRRFGKSLLLNMLMNYYDLANADKFTLLFGHLKIGRQPTPLRNRYFVMAWDFSAVMPQENPERQRQVLFDHLNRRIEGCAIRYAEWLPGKVLIDPENALDSLESLLLAVQQTPYKLYLFIDEYDNFANEVMMSQVDYSPQRYENLVRGEGLLKGLFKHVKAAAAGMGLDRAFITGVSPIAMTDVSSAYNVAKDISHWPEFNDLCGFQEAEIASVLAEIIQARHLSTGEADKALEMMRTFYNGYRFSTEAETLVYNSTLVIYFLEFFHQRGRYPRKLLDENLATDRLKLEYISHLPGGGEILTQVLDARQPVTIPELSERFGVADLLKPRRDRAVTASLLYYLGMLTLDAGLTPFGESVLTVPNLTAKRLYLAQIRTLRLPDKNDDVGQVAGQLYQQGDIQPLCEFIERERLSLFDNRDYAGANELTIKTVFLMLLAENIFYILDSETELQRGYADLTMIVRPDMRQYALLDILIEFKYLSLNDLGLSGEAVREKSAGEMEKLASVKKQRAAAEKKLAEYRAVLEKKYGESLQLRCFSVVAAGFERLLWAAFE